MWSGQLKCLMSAAKKIEGLVQKLCLSLDPSCSWWLCGFYVVSARNKGKKNLSSKWLFHQSRRKVVKSWFIYSMGISGS
jgi:hypothetical protein